MESQGRKKKNNLIFKGSLAWETPAKSQTGFGFVLGFFWFWVLVLFFFFNCLQKTAALFGV